MNNGPAIPALHVEWDGAEVRTEASSLIVSTGRAERTWQWTGKGFVTTSLRNLRTGREWATIAPSVEADWDHAGSSGELVKLTAAPVRSDPFTSDRVEVVASVRYPSQAIRFVIWVFPDSPGLRTQLFVKARPGVEAPALPGPPRVDHIPVSPRTLTRRPIGYYTYTQPRNRRETELLR
ncbi:MAG: hypothetical protein GY953_29920, partial [bacterium]|nr:hypothetical protein [bacterium]